MSKTAGLRTEILTTITLLMGAALLLGGVMMLRLTEQSLLEQKVTQLRLISGTIASTLADSYSNAKQGNPFVFNVLQQLPDQLNHQGWWLYGPDLLLLTSFRSGSGEPYAPARRQQMRLSRQPQESITFPSLLQTFSDVEASAHFALPLFQQERFVGLLEIHYSLEDVRYRLLLSQRMVLLYVLLYGTVLVFTGYYLLQRNVIRPATNLLQATEDVSRGNLETRLPVAGPTEIARLAKSYNHMVEALQASRQETQTHIASLEQANQELQRTRDELIRGEKLASVGQLAAGLAHELGNPLAALIGYLEILKIRLQNDDAEVVRRSLTEAERIDYLVRELLDFSRPTEAVPVVLDPVEVMQDTVELLSHQGALKGVVIKADFPGESAAIKIEPPKLQQVYINLLLNAVQSCGDNGTVQVTAGNDDSNVWLTIADNGCGMSEADLQRIFDPFFTTKPQGRGLGLSICLRFVEDAGGTIKVSSDLNQGSVFTVSFSRVLQ